MTTLEKQRHTLSVVINLMPDISYQSFVEALPK
jgi:hypothetical protein